MAESSTHASSITNAKNLWVFISNKLGLSNMLKHKCRYLMLALERSITPFSFDYVQEVTRGQAVIIGNWIIYQRGCISFRVFRFIPFLYIFQKRNGIRS